MWYINICIILLVFFPRSGTDNLNVIPFDILTAKKLKFPSSDLFLEDRSLHWNFPVITNLERILSSSASSRCLIILDNFRQINVENANLKNPIMIRSHTLHLTQTSSILSNPWIFAPLTLASRNLTMSPDRTYHCPLSKFFAGLDDSMFHTHPFICYKLLLDNFWKHSKPWNCFVQVALYPTLYYYYMYGWLNHDWKRSGLDSYIFPSLPASQIQIFVHEYPPVIPKNSENYRNQNFIYFLTNPLVIGIHMWTKYCQMVFLKFTVLTGIVTSSTSSIFQYSPAFIMMIELLRVCPKFESNQRSMLITPSKIFDFSFLRESILPKNSRLLWYIEGHELGKDIFGCMVQSLYNYGHETSLTTFSKMLNFEETPVEKIGRAFAQIWMYIVGNVTIKIPEIGEVCSFEKNCAHFIMAFTPYVKGSLYFPYFVQDELSSLGFVSCGKPEFSSVPFRELTCAFDEWIWLFLMITMMAVTIPIKSLSEMQAGFGSRCISPLKVFLEQGDPYPGSVINGKRMRWFVGTFLLVGVVMSNAYKNENVYNMITPRKPIPYETFKELIRDNFTIYTRIIALDVFPSAHKISQTVKSLEISQGKYVYLEVDEFHGVAISEISTVARTLLKAFFSLYMAPLSPDIYKWLSRGQLNLLNLLSQTTLTAGVKGMLEDVIKNVISFFRTVGRDPFPELPLFLEKQKDMISTSENEILYNLLKECKNVAVIQPEYLCREVARQLKSSGKRPHVFVGEESYSELQWLFHLWGVIPKRILIRMKATYEAGIWERWRLMFKKSDMNKIENGEVTATTMNGNIVVIFLLWLCGHIGALCCFSSELLMVSCFSKNVKIIINMTMSLFTKIFIYVVTFF